MSGTTSMWRLSASAMRYEYARRGGGWIARSRRSPDSQRLLLEDIVPAAFDSVAAVAHGPMRVASRNRKRDALDMLIAGSCCGPRRSARHQ